MEIEDEEDEKAVAAILLAFAIMTRESQSQRKTRRRSCWTKSWLLCSDEQNIYKGLVNELKLADRADYRRFLRMNTETFEVRRWNQVT